MHTASAARPASSFKRLIPIPYAIVARPARCGADGCLNVFGMSREVYLRYSSPEPALDPVEGPNECATGLPTFPIRWTFCSKTVMLFSGLSSARLNRALRPGKHYRGHYQAP